MILWSSLGSGSLLVQSSHKPEAAPLTESVFDNVEIRSYSTLLFDACGWPLGYFLFRRFVQFYRWLVLQTAQRFGAQNPPSTHGIWVKFSCLMLGQVLSYHPLAVCDRKWLICRAILITTGCNIWGTHTCIYIYIYTHIWVNTTLVLQEFFVKDVRDTL